MASLRIVDNRTQDIVHEIPCSLFALRPQFDDHIKIMAPMMVLLKPGYRLEYSRDEREHD